ncbi:MAG: NADH-quinone oxidoreductase subunit M [Verrucomicrobiota bacterium]|nr:NADH-quinone oxidoreductase subunit M [Verrucomicrobiota bacterium]
MNQLTFHEGIPYIRLLMLLPLVGILIGLILPNNVWQRYWALIVTTANALISLPLYFHFDRTTALFQFAEHSAWIPSLKINYTVGLDGISLTMVLLTTLIMPLCVLASWTYISHRIRAFHLCLLLMEVTMVGVFCALDAILFFMFWEAMLIPMALLIGIWGGQRKIYAAVKFFLYTMAGSIFLLVALIALRLHTGTFNIPDMMAAGIPQGMQLWVFAAFFLAFAVKVPMFPFHTWLPAAHVEAPTAGSVILASVLLKMGTYGFLRFSLPITPDASVYFAPYVLVLSVIAILYGSLTALGQTDLKKLVAYSSVGHMGFATLGIFCLSQQGLEGAVMVMINHGVTTGALFICVGMLYERLHTREMPKMLGIGKHIPIFTGLFGVFCLSSLAFPGTNSFIGEFLVLVATFTKSIPLGVWTIPGVVIVAAYLLRMLQKIAYGGTDNPEHHALKDVNIRELITLLPLFAGVFWIGFHPQPILQILAVSVRHIVQQTSGGGN